MARGGGGAVAARFLLGDAAADPSRHHRGGDPGLCQGDGRVGATITFVSNIPGQTQTLPLAIYAFLRVPGGEGNAARLVWVAIGIAMAALLLSEWVGRAVARRISAA